MSLHIKNLTVSRQHNLVFENITIALDAGDLLLIEGANGVGKTTLLKTIAGLIDPLHGEIAWHNQPNNTQQFLQDLHFVGHANGLKHSLTVLENLKLVIDGNVHTIAKHLQFENLLTLPVANLSQGQKRRVALAKLFLLPKKLWVLDEPLTALDKITQAIFLQHLAEHLNTQGTCILTSHDKSVFQPYITKTLRM